MCRPLLLSSVTVEFNLDYEGSFEIIATVKGEPGIDLQFGSFGTITGDIPVAIDWNGDNRQETANVLFHRRRSYLEAGAISSQLLLCPSQCIPFTLDVAIPTAEQ